LLEAADLDPLFLSWEWMTTWWRHFGHAHARTLRLSAVYRGGALVGIAPLYAATASRRLVNVSSLQFIGTCWRDETVVVSEYLDVIAAPQDRDAVRAAVLSHLADHDAWSELIVGYSDAPTAWTQALERSPLARECHARTIEPSTSYAADLSSGFDAWLGWLGQSSRRSVWNLRRRLEELGKVQVERVEPSGVQPAFAELNRLHACRWGRPAFAGPRLQYHLEFAQRAAERGELALSLLRVDGAVISVLYDVRRGTRQYNLKMAFDPAVERRFSLGLIHFGFALEAAAQAGVAQYDFLAGHGQHSDFKKHLGQLKRELATVQVVRGPLLRRLYGWYDGIQHAMRG